jgi:hypothetical protein
MRFREQLEQRLLLSRPSSRSLIYCPPRAAGQGNLFCRWWQVCVEYTDNVTDSTLLIIMINATSMPRHVAILWSMLAFENPCRHSKTKAVCRPIFCVWAAIGQTFSTSLWFRLFPIGHEGGCPVYIAVILSGYPVGVFLPERLPSSEVLSR